MDREDAPLLSKEAIEAIAERLRPLRRRDPNELLQEARAQIVSQRRATDLLEHPVPFFFYPDYEERGKESPTGNTLHGYDERGRLVYVEVDKKPSRRFTLYQHTTDRSTWVHANLYPRGLSTSQVGEIGRLDGTNYDILLDTIGRIVAFMWPDPATAPRLIQRWELSWERPIVTRYELDERGTPLRIEEQGTQIYPKRRPDPGPVNLDKCAKQLLALVRKRIRTKHEPILLLIAAIQGDDLESIPPSFGVVFQRDAEAFARDPGAYNHDLDKLLSPTLQEACDFPTHTEYPYVDISKEDAPAFDSWTDDKIFELAPQLIDRMNAQRKPTEPPFLLVDMENDATLYLSRLSEDDRKKLEPYGIVAPSS